MHINPGATNRLHEWLFHLATLTNAIGVILVISTTVYFAINDGLSFQIYLVIGIIGAPFALALQTPSSLPYMFATCIQFYLFLPTMVAYFGAYAFSRSWELTWGNRPSDRLISMKQAKSKQEVDDLTTKIQENGKAIGVLIVAANFLLVLTVTIVHSTAPYFVLLLSIIVFFFAAIQMGITFLWVWTKYVPVDVMWWSMKLYLWRKWNRVCCGRKLAKRDKQIDPFEDCCFWV